MATPPIELVPSHLSESDLTEVSEVDVQLPLKTERRRSSRFPVVIPVEVKWREPGGGLFKEAAEAKEVNAQGGLLDMKTYPWVSGNLELTNLLSGQSTRARLVGIRQSEDGAFLGVAVALVFPSESFWDVARKAV